VKVVRVTQGHLHLRCIDCGQEISVLQKGIRKGATYAPRCPNKVCISFWCPRVIELPAAKSTRLSMRFLKRGLIWEHKGIAALLLCSIAALSGFFTLWFALMGIPMILLVAFLFIDIQRPDNPARPNHI
jgi:hypothetical protein